MLTGLGAWVLAMIVLSIGYPLALVVPSLLLNGIFITCFSITGQVYVNSLAEGDLRASVQGLFSCVNGTGLLLGNLLAGVLRQLTGDNLPMAFLVAVGITGTMLTLFALGFERRPRPAVHLPEGGPAPTPATGKRDEHQAV
jgi:MFS family permease